MEAARGEKRRRKGRVAENALLIVVIPFLELLLPRGAHKSSPKTERRPSAGD
jgi:hypothetical protein